jgi:magnesium-transporting ATPase (P-type)
MFYMGGGGITYDLGDLNQRPRSLARQLESKTSPFSLSASISQQRHMWGKIIGAFVALVFVGTFITLGFEINQKRESSTEWHSTHIITLGVLFLMATVVSIFSISDVSSVSKRPHLIATIVLMLSIPIFLTYVGVETSGTNAISLYVVAVFMVLVMMVLVYSYYITKSRLLKAAHGHSDTVNKLTWIHIRNGATIGAAEVTFFTLITIALSVLAFANLDE